MAKKQDEKVTVVKVRLLMDCQHGKIDQVVELDAADLKAAEAFGIADSNPDAVAYALSLITE